MRLIFALSSTASFLIPRCGAFTPPPLPRAARIGGRGRPPLLRLRASGGDPSVGDGDGDDDGDGDGDDDGDSFPCLPPIGGSSFRHATAVAAGGDNASSSAGEGGIGGTFLSREGAQGVKFVADKFELQYTCKVCDHRNSNRVSRLGESCGCCSARLEAGLVGGGGWHRASGSSFRTVDPVDSGYRRFDGPAGPARRTTEKDGLTARGNPAIRRKHPLNSVPAFKNFRFCQKPL